MPPSEGRPEGSALEDEMNKIFTVFPAPRSPSSLPAEEPEKWRHGWGTE